MRACCECDGCVRAESAVVPCSTAIILNVIHKPTSVDKDENILLTIEKSLIDFTFVAKRALHGLVVGDNSGSER